jgi:hypothetical protein
MEEGCQHDGVCGLFMLMGAGGFKILDKVKAQINI